MGTIERGLAAMLWLAWFGCAGNGDDDSMSDDGDDLSDRVDAGGPLGDLVGTWRYATLFGYEERWDLTADGEFRFDLTEEDGDTAIIEGTFSIDGANLELVGEWAGETLISTMSFYASGDVASIPAYLPVGDHDGWVGSWATRYHNRYGRPGVIGSSGEEVLELRDDGCGTWRLAADDGTEPEVREGIWVEGGGVVQFVQVVDDEELLWGFPTLDEAALGGVPLARVE